MPPALNSAKESPTFLKYHDWGGSKRGLCLVIVSHLAPPLPWTACLALGTAVLIGLARAPRRRARYVVPLTQPLAAATGPNDVWTADFKGWFRTLDGTRCDPLTIADAHSRFVLCCRIVPPTEVGVWHWFDRTFREYGLPRALRTDNGAPFAGHGPGRLSRLAVWWLKLGIQLDRIDPGHPEQNGRHDSDDCSESHRRSGDGEEREERGGAGGSLRGRPVMCLPIDLLEQR